MGLVKYLQSINLIRLLQLVLFLGLQSLEGTPVVLFGVVQVETGSTRRPLSQDRHS